MVKYLRCRSGLWQHDRNDANTRTYTTDEARQEYAYRAGKIVGRIKFVTAHALPLHCHGCGNDLLPISYPRLSWYKDMLYDDWQGEKHLLKAWQQGCRRRCRECVTLHEMPEATKTHNCEQCHQIYPPTRADLVCLSCASWRLQAEHWCERCNKNHAWANVHFLHNELTSEDAEPARGVGRVICKGCGPELTTLYCYAWGVRKLTLNFPSNEGTRPERGDVIPRRCWTCFTCCICQTKFAHKRSFFKGEMYCTRCADQRCEACETTLRVRDLNPVPLRNAKHRESKKVCIS